MRPQVVRIGRDSYNHVVIRSRGGHQYIVTLCRKQFEAVTGFRFDKNDRRPILATIRVVRTRSQR